MFDDQRSIASQVHELLLSAHPQTADVNLAKAADLISTEINAPVQTPDDLRAAAFLVIQNLRQAMTEGASAAEGEKLLLEAINTAAHWVQERAIKT